LKLSKYIHYSHQFIDGEDIASVIKILKSDWITQGPKVEEFERALCKYTGSKYAVAVSNGTAALHISSLAAGIKAGDEVITSPVTFVASANCVLYCGGKPVFADVEEDTVNIDPLEIEKKITRKTKAIIPIHFAGHPCDVEKIHGIARAHHLVVIEDAAHALGAEYRVHKRKAEWTKVGNGRFSDMSILSFHPVKSITTGEGGAVLTNRKDLYKKLLVLRNHGVTREKSALLKKDEGPWYYEMQDLGFNYRITDFQCALGISQLKKIDRFIRRRREIAQVYEERMADLEEIILPVTKPFAKPSWHIYCIKVKSSFKREKIFNKLKAFNLGVQIHYIPVYFHPYYQRLGFKKGICKRAENYYRRTITLPIHPSMTDGDVNRVVKKLKEALA